MRVLLFSGGIESTCLAWQERPDQLLFIDYGQVSAKGEERACFAIARELDLPLDVVRSDLRGVGSGTLAGKTAAKDGPAEFWPLRNQLLITLAAMKYFGRIGEILIGTVRSDAHHADGRAPFRGAMQRLLRTQLDCELRAPAAKMSSRSLIEASNIPQDLLGWTFSCHTEEWACGTCSGCRKHSEIKSDLGF
jgi:7-cyano-7-deazaguanine synthase